MTDSIETLLKKPSEQWTLEELKAGFVAALHKLNQATVELEATAEQRNALLELVRLQRQDNQTALAILETTTKSASKKGRGRPRKHDNLLWLYGWWQEARAKYGALNDKPLIKMAFADMYKSNGMRAGRTENAATKSHMESLRKLLIEARQQAERLSV